MKLALNAMVTIAWVFLVAPATAGERDISESDGFVVASVTGEIINGERQRFVFFKQDCENVQHLFSANSAVQAEFDKLQGEILVIEFNGEKMGTKLIAGTKAMAGHLLMFDLGIYKRGELLKHLKGTEQISIRFVDGNGYTAKDYFDVGYNEWLNEGISEAFERAYEVCSSE